VSRLKERLVVPGTIRDEIIAHARDHAPRECCGVIAGKDGALAHLHRLTNLEQGNNRYLFDDEEFYKVYWEIENRGEELISVYHSHPVTVAYPSTTDVEFAFWPEAIYLICSLEFEQSPVIRGFRIVDGEIAEIDLG
jgi:proteasome lid subunit RPN8/RPN11